MPPDAAERRPRREGGAQDDGNVSNIVTGASVTRPGCAWCGDPLPGRRRWFCCDDHRRRGQRAERITETGEFGRAAIRMIRQMARRVGASDIAEFGAMWEVMEESERAVTKTVDDLRAVGFS